MGWIWKDDDDDSHSSSEGVTDIKSSNFNRGSVGRSATRKVVKSHCRTEETEPGKFLRKCEKTEEIFLDCVGRPTELVQSNKEYSEEDVTQDMLDGSDTLKSAEYDEPFNFPGLRNDIDVIGRNFLGSFNQLFEAAEEMKNGFFQVFGDLDMYDGSSSASKRRGIPIEVEPGKQDPVKQRNSIGEPDNSGLTKDV